MQEAIQITFRGMDPSEFIQNRVRAKAAELERFFRDIISCHVTVETQHHSHQKGNLYAVRLDLRVPGKEIVAGREHRQSHAHEDVYVALRDAFDAATRQLEDYARQRRGEVKHHEPPLHGKVVRLFPADGFGFIELPDGSEVYFHERSVVGNNFTGLAGGETVRIVLAEAEAGGGPRASAVFKTGK